MGSILCGRGVEAAIGSLRLGSQYLSGSFTCTSLSVQLPYTSLVFLPLFFRYAGSLYANVWFVRFVHPEIPSKHVVVEFSGGVAERAHGCGLALEIEVNRG